MADGIENVISDQVKTLIQIKADIASAIVSLGGSVNKSDTFASYADKIRNLDPKKNLDLGTLNITSNGSYSASAEGMDGFSSVTVNVTDSGSGSGGSGGSGSGGGDSGYGDEEDLPTYTVTFTNPDDPDFENVEVEVKYGGEAEYTGVTPTKEGNYKFVKWDPVPIHVEADMTCKPIFHNLDAEIEDSWVTICENKGADYEIGEYKKLPLGAVRWLLQTCDVKGQLVYKDSEPYRTVYVMMQKIAENEDGTTSTWLATSPLKAADGVAAYPFRVISEDDYNKTNVINTNTSGRMYNDTNKYPIMNWATSDLRKWLQNDVYKKIPEPVRSSIKKVHKLSSGDTADQEATLNGIESVDTLWIPAYSELYATAANIQEDGNLFYDKANAKLSDMYTRDEHPTHWSGAYWLRSAPQPAARNDTYYKVGWVGNVYGTYGDFASRLVRLGFCL